MKKILPLLLMFLSSVVYSNHNDFLDRLIKRTEKAINSLQKKDLPTTVLRGCEDLLDKINYNDDSWFKQNYKNINKRCSRKLEDLGWKEKKDTSSFDEFLKLSGAAAAGSYSLIKTVSSTIKLRPFRTIFYGGVFGASAIYLKNKTDEMQSN